MGWLDGLRKAVFQDGRGRVAPAAAPGSVPSPPSARGSVGERAAGGSAPTEEESRSDPQVEARRERAAERLLEDERLRGSLTDDEFQPLMEWALAVVDAVAVDTANLTEPTAEERVQQTLSRVRETLMMVDGVAKAGSTGVPARLAELTRAVTAAPDAEQALDRVRRAVVSMHGPRADETSA